MTGRQVTGRQTTGGEDRREELAAALAATDEYPTSSFAGRGIVICAGGARLLTCAWVTIEVLRHTVGCTLPIQLWHLGPGELGPFETTLFEDLGVEVVDAERVRRHRPVRLLGGWELKPYALAYSRFEEVLLLDADNVPALNPEGLFDSRQLQDAGAVFWPDVERIAPDNPVWDLVGLPYRPTPSFESGQILLRKSEVWHSLMVALHLNEHSDLYYRYLNGDKDTFLLGWLLTDRGWAMPRTPPQVISRTIYQHDFEGRVAFQHRTAAKWVLRGENRREPGFAHEQACLDHLAELRALWPGRIVPVPPRSAPARRAERELAAGRWFRYERLGSDTRLLELRPGNRIGQGFSTDERSWCVVDGESDLELVVRGDDSETCRLSRQPDGIWRGRWTVEPGFEVELAASRPPSEGSAPGAPLPGASAPYPSPEGRAASAGQGATADGDPSDFGAGVDAEQVRAILAHLANGERSEAERRAVAATLATLDAALGPIDVLLRRELAVWEERGDPLVASAIREATTRLRPGAQSARLEGRRNPGARPEGPRPGWRYEPLPSPAPTGQPTVLVLTPLKDAASHLGTYFAALSRLDYPSDRLSLGFLEGDSRDDTAEQVSRRLADLRREYRRVTLLRRDFGFQIPTGVRRWDPLFQLARRTVLARARNHLLSGALDDEEWVLWLDVDVIDYPSDVLHRLLATDRDIVQPHCVTAPGGPTFDWNAWREHGQVRMDALRGGQDLVRLDAVGGTMLLVRADVHRNGLVFPPMLFGGASRWARNPHPVFGAPGEVETEGLGIMAKEMGYECWGMPNLEIVHANE